MKVIDIVDEDFVNFNLPSMYIIMPYCNFKCGKENCQNRDLVNSQIIEISSQDIIKRFDKNPITSAIVFGGMEPFDSVFSLLNFIKEFRREHKHPIVIYTGYTEEEVQEITRDVSLYDNIIIKYGRYIPNQNPHYDMLLGVNLASDNQYSRGYNLIEEFFI